MTWTVSVGDFRNNLSDYLARVGLGQSLLVKDEKKGQEIALVTPKKKFDPKAYHEMLQRVSGTISAKDHPEWATIPKVVSWVNKSRQAAERSF